MYPKYPSPSSRHRRGRRLPPPHWLPPPLSGHELGALVGHRDGLFQRHILHLPPRPPPSVPPSPVLRVGLVRDPHQEPLVKHAATAYLQPMSSAPAVDEGKGILGAILDRCAYRILCCGVEDEHAGCCLWWFGDVVSKTAGIGRDGPHDNNHEDDDEDDNEDGEREDCEVVGRAFNG